MKVRIQHVNDRLGVRIYYIQNVAYHRYLLCIKVFPSFLLLLKVPSDILVECNYVTIYQSVEPFKEMFLPDFQYLFHTEVKICQNLDTLKNVHAPLIFTGWGEGH
jgi:hypothetical protein